MLNVCSLLYIIVFKGFAKSLPNITFFNYHNYYWQVSTYMIFWFG